jgi:hypothetical protein
MECIGRISEERMNCEREKISSINGIMHLGMNNEPAMNILE